MQGLALNWRKSTEVEMDRYCHLFEGNYNGRSVRWIVKIKVEFKSKNEHLPKAGYCQETVLGLWLRTNHPTVV